MTVKTSKVALLVETSTTWGAKVIRGIADYLQERHERWLFFVEPRGVDETPRLPPGWRGDGIVARVVSRTLARQIQALRVPCVNVSLSTVANADFPRVTSDEKAVGRLAAEHLLDRGFREFGYLGLSHQAHYVDRCGPAFAREVK